MHYHQLKNMLYFCLMLLIAFNINHINAGIDLGQVLNSNDFQSQLPVKTNLSLDDAKTLFKDKCIEVAGADVGTKSYENIETAVGKLTECITNIANYTAIQEEIQKAKPQGELDVVFSKYCKKRPEALNCIEEFTSKIEPCLDKDERESKDVFMRIARSLLNFVCHKGGDQVALFYAEKGPECLEEKKDDISNCINNTFSGYMPKDGVIKDINSLPKLVIGEKQCNDIQKLETCIVQKLETCSEITPANIIESMFRFIKNETICRNGPTPTVAKQSDRSGANKLYMLNNCNLYILILFIFIQFATVKLNKA